MMRDIEIGLALLGLLVCCVIGLFIIGFTWCCKGEEAIVQELCTRHQYDFCEVIESTPTYKLKEFKE